MIAGFERPTSGRILLDGSDVADTPPHQRNVNTVFQNYALFPHLNVYDNVAFGLKYKRMTEGAAASASARRSSSSSLPGYERRKPSQLSGGQQQRVALARALVLSRGAASRRAARRPRCELRKGLQIELKALQSEVGITFVYVTHDQEEALTMSDRIAVMNGGRVEQVGAASIYENPETVFVADFLGVSNLVAGEAVPGADAAEIAIGDQRLTACVGETSARGAVKVMIRPERVVVEPHGDRDEPPPGDGRARDLRRRRDGAPRADPRRRAAQGAAPERRRAHRTRAGHADHALVAARRAPRASTVRGPARAGRRGGSRERDAVVRLPAAAERSRAAAGRAGARSRRRSLGDSLSHERHRVSGVEDAGVGEGGESVRERCEPQSRGARIPHPDDRAVRVALLDEADDPLHPVPVPGPDDGVSPPRRG